jgi:hypothetical protein
MKIVLSLLAAVVFAAGLASCGGSGEAERTGEGRSRILSTGGTAQAPQAPVLSGEWQQLVNPPGPGARNWTEMTWDSARGEAVLFGGNGIGFRNDIWSYNGTTGSWTLLDPQAECPGNTGFSKPNGTDDSAFRYDPHNNLFWLFGAASGYRCVGFVTPRLAAAGSGSASIVAPDLTGTSSGDYVGWRVQAHSRDVQVSAYDPLNKVLTLAAPIAGLAEGSSYKLYATATAGIWYFDPVQQTWVGQDTPPGNTGPTPVGGRIAPAVDYSSVDRAFVLFGGRSIGSDRSVWKLDVQTKLWTALPVPATAPPHMREMLHSFVYDPQNNVFVLFGGVCSYDATCPDGTLTGQTWVYTLATNTWVNKSPVVAPSPRFQQVMVYDAEHGVIVMHGGVNGANQALNDTWYYHVPSNTWTQVSTAVAPPPRYLALAAYDPLQRRTLLYGGSSSNASLLGDFWQLRLTSANAAPTVALTAPVSGSSYVAPAGISLAANAADSDGSVVRVEFFANGSKIGEDTSAPYTLNWSGVAAGSYAITAVATDNLGASTTSAVVNVTVTAPANAAPTVMLTAPVSGSSYVAPATISLAANAADSDGSVARVEFFANGSKIGEDTSAPYTLNWSGVAAGSYAITAVATDNLGASASSGVVNVTVNPAAGQAVNVALASNGGVASASSTFSGAYPASAVIDGVRNARNWNSGGGWRDGTVSSYPDWIQVSFNGIKSINRIDVITLTDDFNVGADPVPNTTTFSLYGITNYDVQYWNGTAWVTVPGGSIANNNLVWRSISFPTVDTDRIRVFINNALNGSSRVAEIEAWSVN